MQYRIHFIIGNDMKNQKIHRELEKDTCTCIHGEGGAATESYHNR